MTREFVPGIYQHYKTGNYYVARTVVQRTEDGVLEVEYAGPPPKGPWSRSLSEFMEEVETEAGKVPRFRLITPIKFTW